ncbi:lysine-specific demethylase 2A [Micropterus salmoides]|uniref:lysine-specific demethylase 2A n=1 Tax=Micropterus salmoides TaxID=27706 RepID=UPI0018EACBEA|nr:lysine-specific demethylase 2A [Micropterus salmoides]XP_045924603.1 lysine-specific demethylase 2A [Micropterus dolomieu]XP_045924609.1 lysine-specific demethylase 2A [Micropterus dolomieu]
MEDPHTRYSKRLRTGTRRRYQDDGISDDEIEGKRTFDLDEKLQCVRFSSDLIKHMEGKDFTFEYIQREGLREPIIFDTTDGLGLQMPDSDFSVSDVKLFVGSRRIVDVMDVNTQKGIEMSMAQWRRYYETPPSEREKLYNVISLEFSHTRLENLVKRPASVDLIDWVDNMWPRHLKERQRDSTNAIIDMHYPKVQKYCLMSVQGCFTDFHIDFGGTSVWYHILRGGKVFWLIPPTPQNLEMYENWVLSGKQGDIFLGDKCHDCQRTELKQGNTFIIPSGWIHAVYTPEDTLVFGGNFLHSFNIPMQLNIYSIEDRTRVPSKFRYPFYYEMCWYVLERYLYCLTNISHLTPEFQKYSLGIGLTQADLETNDNNGNGTSSGVDSGAENGEIKLKEENEIKEEDEPAQVTAPQQMLTPFELEGLWNLYGKLEELPAHKKCVPAGIRNAAALLEDMRALLENHANDNPKLSYTGEPIVKWPARPSWYHPPAPPPPVLYRPRLGPSLHKPLGQRSTKRSSISALRRRRVRCKRCAACCRKECGTCQYCHDMRKFGGPGRMKKSCIMRQCLAPALPNTARCAICGEGESEESNPSAHSLMECSVCSQIAHRQCIKDPGEGKINKDLPSCWECPKCYPGKDSEASESSSDEESGESEGSLPPSKLAYREGIGVGEGVRRGRRSRPPSRPTAPPPSQKLLLQHQQNRKRASALELRLKKRIKLERSKILTKSSLDRSPRLLGSRVLSRLRSPTSRLSQGRGRGSTWASGSPYHSSSGGAGSVQQQQSSLGLVLEPKGEPRRGRGRGVRLRGGGAGRGIRSGRSQHGELEEDESEDSSSSSNSSSSSDNDEEWERRQNSGQGLDKENQPQSRRGGQAAKEGEEERGEVANQNGAEEEEVEQDSQTGGKDGSHLKVTLQKPTKAKRDPSAIVPKLEAVAPQTATSTIHNQTRTLVRPPIRNCGPCPDQHSNTPTPPHTRSGQTYTHTSHPKMAEASKRAKLSRPAKLSNGASCSSSSELPHLRIPLSALQGGGSEADREGGGNGPGCEREVWVSVFRYLSRADLCVCMAVCKNWYKWCLDKRLWARIDLSIKRTVTPQALTGIIKRQPVTLDLSWTNISKKQLNWLVGRLPGLKDLMLAGCSWSSISALCSSGCPLLRSLDLRYADGVKDTQIRDLVTPPGCDNRSQLRTMQCLRLAGLDISDSTLRLVIRHMPHLTKLDLSHCNSLTDHSINLLTAVGSSTRNTLTELNLGGCSKLTDSCLKYLRRLSFISLLDLRGCKSVSRKACEAFISELSVNTLYCLSDEKLIQRIS